jgi:short-subunit dehydrogenase
VNIVITGASSGLGEVLAKELGRRGHNLGLVARRVENLKTLAAEIRAMGGQACVAAADVTDRLAIHAAIARIEGVFGPIDIAIANAGGGARTPATAFVAADVSRVFRLNVDGVANTFEAVLPSMLARGAGQIVAVSSLAAWRGLPPSTAYSASKIAVTTLLEGMRVELAPLGIAVTTIHPGFVKTPLTEKNEFGMPFLLEADDAARRMADGILARKREVNFPFQLTVLMRVVHWLPAPIFEYLARRLMPKGEKLQ